VVLSHCSDNAQPVSFRNQLAALFPAQNSVFKMALLALFVGAFYWVAAISVSPEKNLLSICTLVVEQMLAEQQWPVMFELQLTATFLYFLLLAMFSLRIFFSVPLVLFHELNNKEAQALSHRAILINLRPMSTVLFIWIIAFMGSMAVAPVLAALMFPLFAAFIYVAYRHVFLGETENKAMNLAPAKVQLARVNHGP
jgi:hypothetical protein